MARHGFSFFDVPPSVSSSSEDSFGIKRAGENSDTDSNSSKRLKKIASVDRSSDDEKNAKRDSIEKRPVSKLFNEEDQLTILKGQADFITQTGKNPMEDTWAFYNFVKDSMHANVTKDQLVRKIRTMRIKFESKTYGDFTKEHDQKAFELFQKIEFKKLTTAEKGSGSGSVLKNVKTVKDELCFTEISRFSDGLGLPMEMELMEESDVGDLKERWVKAQIFLMKVVMARAGIVRDQLSEIVGALEACETSN